MKACPYRKDFYEKLGSPPEKVNEELDKWLAALDKIVTHMQDFYDKGGYGKGRIRKRVLSTTKKPVPLARL